MNKNVLVFFSYASHKTGYIELLFDRLQQTAKDYPLNLHRGALKDLHITVKDNQLKVVDPMSRRDLASFDSIYFELWYKCQQQALAAALYAKRKNVPFFSEELAQIMPITKVGELAAMADNDISLPQSFTSSSRQIKKVFKKDAPLSFPLIVKADNAYGGKNNFLVHDYNRLCEVLDENKDLTFVLQEFIPNDCDYRCLVIGGEIRLVLQRTRDKSANTHLNNTSRGAEGKMIPVDSLPQAARDTVVKAAKLLKRGQFAGVDLLINKETGQHYILEVNQTPQIEIGAEVDKKMNALLQYITKLSGGEGGGSS